MADDQTFYRNLSITGHLKENLREILQAWLDEIIEKELHRREVSALNEILESKMAPMVVTLEPSTYKKFAGIAKARGFDYFAREVKDSDRIAVIFSQRMLEQYRACAKDAMAYSRAYTEEDLDNIAIANGYKGEKTIFKNVNKYVAQSIERQLLANGKLHNVVIQDNPDNPKLKNLVCLKESETFLAKAISDAEFCMLGTCGRKEAHLQQYIEANRGEINRLLEEVKNGTRSELYITSTTKPKICLHITKDSFETLFNGEHVKGNSFFRQDKTIETTDKDGNPVMETYKDIWFEERLREKIDSLPNPVPVSDSVVRLGINTPEYEDVISKLTYKNEMTKKDAIIADEWVSFKKFIDERSGASGVSDYLSINDNISPFLINAYVTEKGCNKGIAIMLQKELDEVLPILKNKEIHISVEHRKPIPHSLEDMIKGAEKKAEMGEQEQTRDMDKTFPE